MGDYQPKYKPGATINVTLTAAVTGGQLVTVAGAVAGADSSSWIGVASRDAVAGETIGVYCEGVQRVTTAGALAQGALLKCAANGQVTTWVAGTDSAEKFIGVLMEAAAGAGSVAPASFVR